MTLSNAFKGMLLALLVLSNPLALAENNSVNPQVLELEVQQRMNQVEEFEFLQRLSKKYNTDIYLFGGTASAFAHYVRLDMLRESGDTRFQPERFDYFFDNIYRGNQDLDIVVDSDVSTADKIRDDLKDKYPHLVGSRTAWEVRLLRHSSGDKDALLDNKDFTNQHSDSNSIGVVKVNTTGSQQTFYDLRDWSNKSSLFLNDIANNSITYLHSPKHKTTKRFKKGDNPLVLSAIRYLAKATQYELELKPEDIKKITAVIKNTQVKNLNSYSKKKILQFAEKALLNSPNVEYAWNLLEKTGARQLAIDTDEVDQTVESTSWWMNKEPLRNKPIGQGFGKTAEQLGISIVSHETNTLQAFENITRSSQGSANVFISRENTAGEGAAYGNGFYTRQGTSGAAGSNITTRFKLNPKARKGSDFHTNNGDYVIVTNKNALELIPEKVNLDTYSFFQLLISGGIKENDKGFLYKIKRRLNRTENSLSKEKADLIVQRLLELIETQRANEDINAAISEWLDFEISIKYPEVLLTLSQQTKYHVFLLDSVFTNTIWKNHESMPNLLLSIVNSTLPNHRTKLMNISSLLKNESWAHHPLGPQIFVKTFRKLGTDEKTDLITEVFSMDHWVKHEEFLNITKELIKKVTDPDDDFNDMRGPRSPINNNHFKKIIEDVLSTPSFFQRPDRILILLEMIKLGAPQRQLEALLENEVWSDTKSSHQILNSLMQSNNYDNDIILELLTHEHWAKNMDYVAALKKIIPHASEKNLYSIIRTLTYGFWTTHTEAENILKLLLKREEAHSAISTFLLKNETWGKRLQDLNFIDIVVDNEESFSNIIEDWLPKALKENDENALAMYQRLLDNKSEDYRLIKYVLSPPAIPIEKATSDLEIIFNRNTSKYSVIKHILSKKKWAKTKNAERWLESLIATEGLDHHIIEHVLSKKFWIKHPKHSEYLKIIFDRGFSDSHIAAYILRNKNYPINDHTIGLINSIIANGRADAEIKSLLWRKDFVQHEASFDTVKKLIDNKTSLKDIARVLTYEDSPWNSSDKQIELIKYLALSGIEMGYLVNEVLSKKHLANHKSMNDLTNALMQSPGGLKSIIKYFDDNNDEWHDFKYKVQLLKAHYKLKKSSSANTRTLIKISPELRDNLDLVEHFLRQMHDAESTQSLHIPVKIILEGSNFAKSEQAASLLLLFWKKLSTYNHISFGYLESFINAGAFESQLIQKFVNEHLSKKEKLMFKLTIAEHTKAGLLKKKMILALNNATDVSNWIAENTNFEISEKETTTKTSPSLQSCQSALM